MTNQVLKVKATIQENSDDGKEAGSSTWNKDGNVSSVITLGNFSGVQTGAFRFRAIDIPKFSKVLLARLRLRPAFTDDTDFTTNLKIQGVKEPDPSPFKSDGSNRPSTRTKTTNAVDWDIIKKWEVHEWVQTPNLNLVVEELLAQNGWKPGNAMVFIITDDGSPAENSKTCYDSSKGEGYEAELEIYYLRKDYMNK